MRTYRARLLAAASVALVLATLPAAATSSGDRLIAAAQDGLTTELDALIAKHADVNATDSAGATALAWAVMRGNDEVAARLLKAHADPNIAPGRENRTGRTRPIPLEGVSKWRDVWEE